MLGRDVLDRVRVVNHDARDDASLRWVGRLAGDVPVWLNQRVARRRRPHHDRLRRAPLLRRLQRRAQDGGARASPAWRPCSPSTTPAASATRGPRGGSPSATPSTTRSARSPSRPASTSPSTCCSTGDHRIVEVFAGDLLAEHAAGLPGGQGSWPWPRCPAPFDVVVTTNAGFPLDQNLYQCVKGLAAGAAVVRPGGTLICAAECRDGFPDHGSYREVLASQPLPGGAAARDRGSHRTRSPDQWQVQVQARVQSRARVVMCTAGLTRRRAGQRPPRTTPTM